MFMKSLHAYHCIEIPVQVSVYVHISEVHAAGIHSSYMMMAKRIIRSNITGNNRRNTVITRRLCINVIHMQTNV